MNNSVLDLYKQYFPIKGSYEKKANYLKECKKQAELRKDIYPNLAQGVLDWIKEEFHTLAKK